MNVLGLQCDPLTVSIVAEIPRQLSVFVSAFVMCATYIHISRIKQWSDRIYFSGSSRGKEWGRRANCMRMHEQENLRR